MYQTIITVCESYPFCSMKCPFHSYKTNYDTCYFQYVSPKNWDLEWIENMSVESFKECVK